jgi:hypothetical protein
MDFYPMTVVPQQHNTLRSNKATQTTKDTLHIKNALQMQMQLLNIIMNTITANKMKHSI